MLIEFLLVERDNNLFIIDRKNGKTYKISKTDFLHIQEKLCKKYKLFTVFEIGNKIDFLGITYKCSNTIYKDFIKEIEKLNKMWL